MFVHRREYKYDDLKELTPLRNSVNEVREQRHRYSVSMYSQQLSVDALISTSQ